MNAVIPLALSIATLLPVARAPRAPVAPLTPSVVLVGDTTLIAISGNTPPEDPLPSTCSDITICVSIAWCSGTEFCQECEVCIDVDPGDTRKSVTAELAAALRDCLPEANIVTGDVTINISGTPKNAPQNSGTPETPKKSPPDGEDSRVYSSQYTE